jgi:hypothetical protein
MAVFDMLRDQLHFVLWGVGSVIQAKVSLDRVSEFLNKVRNHPCRIPFAGTNLHIDRAT